MSDAVTRYALYYAPEPHTALWQFGSAVLAYDAASVQALTTPDFAGTFADRWMELTHEPRKYGFHATLKAPFRLHGDFDEERLVLAMHDFARVTKKASIEGLAVGSIGPFIALKPVGDDRALNQLAARIVDHFDAFRAPLSDDERARRLKSPLTGRQMTYLEHYGYPYVHEEFRFHMTLTHSLHVDDRDAMRALLDEAYRSSVSEPVRAIDRICLYKQDAPDMRFRIIADATLS
jgi:putative phosphonate metabolism protein